jgi:uncharacterized protein YbaR (Trm112 family)
VSELPPPDFEAACPLCHALLAYRVDEALVCPHCNNRLLVGYSDPSKHVVSEIDPEVSGKCFGGVQFVLHPPGTRVCAQCGLTFPETFECCPGLVDLALATYRSGDHGPTTDRRIEEFLDDHPRVVAATARLRAYERRGGLVSDDTYARLRRTLEALNRLDLLPDDE